ncbi:MAG TPA: hypothetical protein VFD35_13830 [Pricia sp.]|nr:hypothetical protein [Pricia sp.]
MKEKHKKNMKSIFVIVYFGFTAAIIAQEDSDTNPPLITDRPDATEA